MQPQNVQNDWNATKSQIKMRFGKLTDDSIEAAKDNLDLLVSKIQHTYGYAKEQAEKEFTAFRATLHAATAPEKGNEKPTDKPAEKSAEDTKTPILTKPAIVAA